MNSQKRITLGFGTGSQSLELPEAHILQIIEGNKIPAIADIEQETLRAIRNPIGSEQLSRVVAAGERVAIIVSDITRKWIRIADFLLPVVNELNATGIPDRDICIVVAQGSHRKQTPSEDIAVCGAEVARRLTIHQHDCLAEDLVHIGTTSRGTPVWINRHVAEADKVILTGGITVHFMAGFGGGRKSVVPGVAGDLTIQKNHSLALSDVVGNGISDETRTTLIDHNRLNDDMCEACGLLNPCFLVNAVMTDTGDFARIVAGHWHDAWLEGTKEVMRLQGVRIKDRADVVIASAGGSPKDINLYQGCKTFDTLELALKSGGIAIVVLECPEIQEPPEFMGCFRFSEPKAMEAAIRKHFTIPFFVAFRIFLLSLQNTIYMVTKPENFAVVRKTGMIPVATVAEAWARAEQELARRGMSDYTINVMPHGANTVPILR
jgi:nickel-dependent lactate racemase